MLNQLGITCLLKKSKFSRGTTQPLMFHIGSTNRNWQIEPRLRFHHTESVIPHFQKEKRMNFNSRCREMAGISKLLKGIKMPLICSDFSRLTSMRISFNCTFKRRKSESKVWVLMAKFFNQCHHKLCSLIWPRDPSKVPKKYLSKFCKIIQVEVWSN